MKKLTQNQLDSIMGLTSCIVAGISLIGLIFMGAC